MRLACSSQINTPMLMGVFHPVIVVPRLAYTANGMGREFCSILDHELTHYKRHDIVYKWLIVIVTSLHWFNPLVYLIRREIGNACELSCDEAVIKNLSISERKEYGNTLLALASKRRIPVGVMATTLCEGKKQLKGRLISIMNYKKKTHAAVALMVVLTLLLTGCAAGIAAFTGSANKPDGVNGSTLLGEKDNDQEGLNQPSANPDGTDIASPLTGDNENPGSAQPSDNTSILETYKAVLQGNTEFFSVDANKNLNISQLNQSVSSDSGITAKATRFAIVDLDNDGAQEVILWLTVNNDDYYGFEVLRYQNGVVYGYTLWYRSFMNLKADGTFSFSGGAADNGFGTVKFTENTYAIDEITYSESSYDSNDNRSVSYFVNHESATEDEFMSAVDLQSEKADAEWHDFTDDNIGTILTSPHNDALAAYNGFLAGSIKAQDPQNKISNGVVSIKDITLEPDLKTYYALFDMNGDGIPELHLRPITGGSYAIFTYLNGQIVLWYQGTDYESPLNNGAILYERDGAAPAHVNYSYFVLDFDGNKISRVDFSKYHSVDESGLHESADYDVFQFDNKNVSKEEWNALTKEYLSIVSDLIIWNEA